MHPAEPLNMIFSAGQQLSRTLGFGVPDPLMRWVAGADQADRLWQRVMASAGPSIFDRVLLALEAGYRSSDADFDRIPRIGPLVLVSNHPFGLLDGLILGSLAHRRRPDFRILANNILATMPAFEPYIIGASIIARDVHFNGPALRSALRWIRSGGALVLFPAGEVSAPHGMPPAIVDPQWNDRILRLALAAQASVVPIHISGRNSAAFHCAGLLHPMLRTALLGRELWNKRGTMANVRVGRPISPERFRQIPETERTSYVRRRTYLLAERGTTMEPAAARANRRPDTTANPVDPAALAADIALLPESALLVRGRGYAVYLAGAQQIPNVLTEIGRLREVTFRSVGEGTGHASDLDQFDTHYQHLFLWSERNQEVAGAYRLARVDETLSQLGARGLYTHRLFQLSPEFLDRIAPGLDLGRSFVRQEYQRSLHPLYYLWKGIGACLARDPSRRYLFGPVSISDRYCRAAREIMVHYFHGCRTEAGRPVRPRRPFQHRPFGPRLLADIARETSGIEELSSFVADLEPDGKGIPVLLRHYLGLGADVLDFNVDPEFSNALDALIVVDLTRSHPAALEKYLGTEGLSTYLAYQASLTAHPPPRTC